MINATSGLTKKNVLMNQCETITSRVVSFETAMSDKQVIQSDTWKLSGLNILIGCTLWVFMETGSGKYFFTIPYSFHRLLINRQRKRDIFPTSNLVSRSMFLNSPF